MRGVGTGRRWLSGWGAFLAIVGCNSPKAIPVVDDWETPAERPAPAPVLRQPAPTLPRAGSAFLLPPPEGRTPGAEAPLHGYPELPQPPPPPPPPKVFPEPCGKIFADEAVQTFELQIDPAEWARLQQDFAIDGLDEDEYRPLLSFKHEDKLTTDAMIRLRGNTSTRNEQAKMQFQISFNETNKDGRFRGLRKIVLDANHFSKTYLRDRLAMSMARDAGLPASCVNHARLYVNGQFYGLFGNIEKVDRELLERNFEDPSGNLWKRGQIQKTNEDDAPDPESISAFWDVQTAAELAELGDLRQMIRAWALEAILPNGDGYWAGGWNFYLYDHPERGFLYLLWDVDQSFDSEDEEADPLTWHKTNEKFNGRPHVEAVLADPYWRGVFVEEVRSVRQSLDLSVLLARVDLWAAQIRDSAYEDVLAPWDGEEHEKAVERLRDHLEERFEFIDDWLEQIDAAGTGDGGTTGGGGAAGGDTSDGGTSGGDAGDGGTTGGGAADGGSTGGGGAGGGDTSDGGTSGGDAGDGGTAGGDGD